MGGAKLPIVAASSERNEDSVHSTIIVEACEWPDLRSAVLRSTIDLAQEKIRIQSGCAGRSSHFTSYLLRRRACCTNSAINATPS